MPLKRPAAFVSNKNMDQAKTSSRPRYDAGNRLFCYRLYLRRYQESSGNEDLIDILTRIMLYLSKVFDIKNPSFK